ncbi:MAG: hypothetical protein GX495_08975 [Chloroflexi bacterium]|nr:hypothetical protein [Chloroflexota bacterium]
MQTIFISLLIALVGLVLLLFGYRVFLMMLPVWGFLSGFWLGADLTALSLGSGCLGSLAGWLVGLALGLVSALLAQVYVEMYIGVIGAVIGYQIGSGLFAALGLGGLLAALAGLVLALVTAGFFYMFDFKRLLAMAVTAVYGASALILAALLLVGRVALNTLQSAGDTIQPVLQDSFFWLLLWLALAVAGYFIQDRTSASRLRFA